ncbi:MAG: AAA family ATPase [Cyanobacteria bacterium REEB67]|nr:AAA family ATPase [Cyanobacteria bacterium REEB67]
MNDSFVETRQHKRFVEFADSCRKSRGLGICTGKPGVGKESSALMYSQWANIQPLLERARRPNTAPPKLTRCHTGYWSAEVNCTLKCMRTSITLLRNKFDSLVKESVYWHEPERWHQPIQIDFMELLIVNNAHRLSYQCLEALNDFRKKHRLGLILIGSQGFDRRIRIYDLLDCDVSLYHEYSKPRAEELREILTLAWQSETVTVDDAAITIIEEASNLNIHKALKLQREIERVRTINSITVISPEVVHAAGASLLMDLPARPKT